MFKKEFFYFIIAILFFSNCSNNEFDLIDKNKVITDKMLTPNITKSMLSGILQTSYEITTWTVYDMQEEKLSDLDMAYLNPKSEKQKITMSLSKDGDMSLTIVELDFKNKIKIQNRTQPSDIPEITRTEVLGNTAHFYDKNGKLINSEHIEMPKQMEMVEKINKMGSKFSAKDLNEAMAKMQGQFFEDNINEFIEDAIKKGAQVLKQEDHYIALRISMKQIDPRIKEEAVLLINRKINKLVGSRIYDANNELVQKTYYGYSKGKAQLLNAIKTEEKMTLPSGKTVNMISYLKIDNLKFNLNI